MKAYATIANKLDHTILVKLIAEDGRIRLVNEYKDVPTATKMLTSYCQKAGLQFSWEDESNEDLVRMAKREYESVYGCSFEGVCN